MNSAAELLVDLARRGIRLEARGDRLRYHPQSAVTPDLLELLKADKAALLALLRPAAEPDHHRGQADAAARWEAALERLEGDPLVPIDAEGWPADSIDPNELEPCPKCQSLELWQSVVGGRWRCLKCDPPTAAERGRPVARRGRR
jgi:hypothetical protein